MGIFNELPVDIQGRFEINIFEIAQLYFTRHEHSQVWLPIVGLFSKLDGATIHKRKLTFEMQNQKFDI